MIVRRFVPAIVVALLVGGFALFAMAASARAQERENCPDGFFWVRMSGQCCVQDQSTLPAHGKIGYTGNSLCEDNWYEVYDRRATTNGEGPPGCPGYTSFVFLLECVSSFEEAQQRQAEIDAAAGGSSAPPPYLTGGDSGLNPLSDALYGGGGMPSKSDLALTGGIIGSLLAGIGLSTLRGSGGTVADRRTRELLDQLKSNERELAEAQAAVDKAREDREALWQQRREFEAAAETMRSRLELLDLQMRRFDANIDMANKGKYALFALGLIATIVSLEAALPVAGAAALTGLEAWNVAVYKFLVALETGGGGFLSGMMAAEWQRLKLATSEAKTNVVLVRDGIVDHVKDLSRQYDDANARLDAATQHMNDVRAEGARISQQIANP